jgi:FxsC-like protein
VLYFFLSYAREDDPEYVRRFFHDLSSQVRNLSGADRDEPVGFLDEQSLRMGQRWSVALGEALSTCRCFVAMTSPRYFRRDYCGREWAVFSDRLAAYERQWNRQAPALLPIRWIPMSPMHPLAAEIQGTGAGLAAESYLDYGLRQMLDLQRFHDDYRAFVFDLARLIVSVAGAHDVPVPRRTVRLEEVQDAFRSRTPGLNGRVGTAAHRGTLAGGGRLSPRAFVHFIVVAGTRDDMSTVRRKLEYYGETSTQWAPYRPGFDEAVAELAMRVAEDRLFDSEIADISDLGQRIDRARQRNELVVLLVDAWSPALERHQRALLDYDQRDGLAGAVMIPFNSQDAETLADTTVLQVRLARVLPNLVERGDRVMLRSNIPTPEQFGADLEEILEVAQNRIFRTGTVNPQVPDGPSRSRPILEGPTNTLDGDQA